MNGIIISKGKYGATQQYAEWLSAALRIPFVNADEFSGEILRKYDFLVLGSSVYIGKLQLTKWLKQNQQFIEGKKVYFFQVAAAPPEERGKRAGYNRSSIPETIFHNCDFYYLPGKMIMKNLSGWDRFMLRMGARFTKDPVAKKNMLTDFDHLKRDAINEMLASITEYSHTPESRYAAIGA